MSDLTCPTCAAPAGLIRDGDRLLEAAPFARRLAGALGVCAACGAVSVWTDADVLRAVDPGEVAGLRPDLARALGAARDLVSAAAADGAPSA